MRNVLLVTIVGTTLLASGCTAECGSPQQLNGQRYRVFANQLELVKAQNLEGFTAGPDFLSYGSPINGETGWVFDWGAAETGPVTVTIDGQPFEGTAAWDPIECGNFDLQLDGEYVSGADSGSTGAGGPVVTHSFSTSGSFVVYDNVLEGEVEWIEGWSTDDGRNGTYRVFAALRGEL